MSSAGRRKAQRPSTSSTTPVSSSGSTSASTPGGSWSTGRILLLALGVTGCVVAWGYLVFLAIDFGTSSAWGLLTLACVGAVACLFVGLMLFVQLGSALRPGTKGAAPAPPRIKGGKRAAR